MRIKFAYIIGILILIAQNLIAQVPDWQWAKSMADPGGPGNGTAKALAHDKFGNIYSTGPFDGPIDFDPGPGFFQLTGDAAFITKMDPAGNLIWAKSFTGFCIGNSIALDDSGNVYVAGSFSDSVDFDPGPGVYNITPVYWMDIFVAKLDSAGNFLWAHGIGGQGFDYSTSIKIEDGSGDLFITGAYGAGTVDFDPGPGIVNLTTAASYCMFIWRLNSSGNFVGVKSAAGANSWGNALAFDPSGSGDIYIAGGFSGTSDFDPDTGVYNLTAAGLTDLFIARFDSLGTLLWAEGIGGPNFDEAVSIAVSTTGKIFTTGTFSDSVDFDPGSGISQITSRGNDDIFILKIDVAGNFEWVKTIGGIDYDYGTSLVLNPLAEEIYLTGTFIDTIDFDPGPGTNNIISNLFGDMFISKINGAGDFLWTIPVGGTSIDYSNTIICNDSGSVFIAGNFFSDTVAFGSIILSNPGNSWGDIFIAKLESPNATGINGVSLETKIVNVFPNPFSNTTTISFKCSRTEKISLKIFDVNGSLLKEFVGGECTNGECHFVWMLKT